MAIEVLTNLNLEAEPVAPEHVPNIKWVMDFFTGKVKMPVRVAATSNQVGTYATATMTFTYGAVGQITIDGVALAVGDRVLLAGQTAASQNGIYDVTAAGNPTTAGQLHRSDDFNAGNKIFGGLTVAVNSGTEHANQTFKLVADDPVILDTTALNWIISAPTTGATKYAEDIDCDGIEKEWEIEHELGTDDVTVELWNRVTKGMVLADIEVTDDDTVTIAFDQVPPNTARYRVVVVG